MADNVPFTAAQTIHPNNEQNVTPTISYSPEAQAYINFRRSRMVAARDMRDMPRQEWDDMGFLKWYEVMKKADDQYVAPRKNKQDTAINLGTIRDKDTSLLEYAMKYDFEPVAQVYDQDDDMLQELAETAEDMVLKSKMLEEYRAKAKLIYRSMVAFGTALVEDAWVERWTIEKTFGKGAKVGSESATWDERKVKTYDGCQSKLWDLRKCYFGDIRKFFMNGPQGQPFFFTAEYESYDVVKGIFGDWDRFKYVPNQIVYTGELQDSTTYSDWWTLRPVSMNYVEIVRYYDPIANEFAITLNGVDMLPIMEKKITQGGIEKTLVSGFPLTAISPSGAIPLAKFDLEPMHEFAYSKPQPAKMRVLADVENMIIKLLIILMKQKAKPTMGNRSGRMFGEEVSEPATVINDVREGDLFPILPNFQGAQPADFSLYELVKKELDKNSIERSFQGMDNGNGAGPSPSDETATKSMNDMKAQSLKVASMFDGIIYGENQLAWLRTYNIARNWTKPIDKQIDVFNKVIKDVYRTVTMPTEVDGGQKATKRIIFTKDTPKRPKGKPTLEDSQDIHQEEMDSSKKGASPEIRITRIHPELFATMRLSWFYTHVPVPNGQDPLSYMMFAKQIQDAIVFFGPQSLNVKRLKHRFASITGNDYDTWFLSESELQQAQQEAMTAAASGSNPQGAPGAVPGKGAAPNAPSIAGAAKGAIPAMSPVMR